MFEPTIGDGVMNEAKDTFDADAAEVSLLHLHILEIQMRLVADDPSYWWAGYVDSLAAKELWRK